MVDPAGEAREAAFTLRRRVFIDEQRVPPDEEYDDLDAPGSPAVHVVLLDGDGRATGTGRVLVDGEIAKMQRIAVDRALRQQGIGRRVMEALEDLAAERGATTARLSAQLQAIPFYERVGYVAWGGEFLEAGIRHRWMDKALA